MARPTLVALALVLVAVQFSAFASALRFTNSRLNVTDRRPCLLMWTEAVGTVTLTLMQADDASNLQEMVDLGSGLEDDSYVWTPIGFVEGIYVIRAVDSLEFAYTKPFTYRPNLSPTAIAPSTATWFISIYSTPTPTQSIFNGSNINPNTNHTSGFLAPTTLSSAAELPDSAGLSVGTKAGIAVGASAAGLALIGAAVMIWFRRRRQGGSGEGHNYPPDDNGGFMVTELGETGVGEMCGKGVHRAELEASGHWVELPTTSPAVLLGEEGGPSEFYGKIPGSGPPESEEETEEEKKEIVSEPGGPNPEDCITRTTEKTSRIGDGRTQDGSGG